MMIEFTFSVAPAEHPERLPLGNTVDSYDWISPNAHGEREGRIFGRYDHARVTLMFALNVQRALFEVKNLFYYCYSCTVLGEGCFNDGFGYSDAVVQYSYL